MVQIGLLDVVSVINWCIDQLEKYEGQQSSNFAPFQLALDLVGWSQSQRQHIVCLFVQESDKVSEVKIETAYEQRMREQAEAESRPWEPNPLLKTKTAEEIKQEKQQLEAAFRTKFEEAANQEKAALEQSLKRLENKPKLQALADKIALQSQLLKFTTVKAGDIAFQNDLVSSILRD